MSARIYIGTSGWHYKHWVGTFYPPKMPASKMFAFYQQHFDTVELNNSFYRLPTAEAFVAWREAAPDNFCFAVKGSRFLTHNKKLKEPEQALQNLLPRAELLGEKLGPILFQLPPKWKVNLERLELFLQALPTYNRYAFEFREPSWNRDEVYEVLRRHNAAYCVHEARRIPHAHPGHCRLHLRSPARSRRQVSGLLRRGQIIGVGQPDRRLEPAVEGNLRYLDNDDSGYAPRNALELKQLVGKSS